MSDLFLIAHKVRGLPAFDIAERHPCPICQTFTSVTGETVESRKPQAECEACERKGYWWNIPTSGHRAYPYWSFNCQSLLEAVGDNGPVVPLLHSVPPMPVGLRDHYHQERLSKPKAKSNEINLTELGL